MIVSWDIIADVIANHRLVLLYGPPGTGKTTIANRAGDPTATYNVTLSDETPSAELRGHFLPVGDKWEWHDGPAMSAFRNGGRLVLNEIDKASADTLDFLHGLLDDVGISAFTLPTGETVKPHPNFSVVATMNGVPEDLPDALRDRFSGASILVDEPHPDAISGLPKELQEVVKGTVWAEEDGRRVSVRKAYAYVSLSEKIGEENAARVTFGNRAADFQAALKLAASR